MSTPQSLSHPHLRDLQAALEAVNDRGHALKSLTEEQLSWSPAPGSWNILECLDHLITTDELYLPRIRKAIDAASPGDKEAPYRPSFFGKKFIEFISPDPKRKAKTFAVFEPQSGPNDVTLLERFLEHQEAVQALLRQADEVNLNRSKLASPVTRLMRFTVGEALTMLIRHQERHLQQAENLTRHPGFPATEASLSS